MKLFEGQDAPQGKLQVNKQYAEKFRKKKERELLDKAEREQIQPDSDSSIEDEDGQLVNEKITDKFIETLAKIKFKHPDIYQRKESIFSEQDFEDPIPQKKVKKLTYKDQLIDEEQEYQPKNGITPVEEQQQLKNAFKKAAEQSQKLSEKELLKIKRKNLKEIEDENKEFDKFLKHHKPQEQDLLQRFWGNEEDLDEKDKFLRKYILTKGWIDKEDMDDFQDSDEDEDKMDQFEEKYNFRYEEPGGAQIITYERDQPDTLRIQEEKARKRQRLAKQQRREEQKKQLEQELKQLKIAKKNEIIDKLQKIQEIGGLKDTKLLLEEIQKEEFDPSTFDKKMNQVFDKQYFQDEDSVSEMQIEQVDDQEDDKHQDINNVIQIKPNIPLISRKNLNDEDIKVLQDEEVNIWWFCDYCKNGIDPGSYRWDCQICDDYTLCENCQSFHQQHKLKKSMIPKSCKPPEQEDLEKLISIFRYCRTCSIKMTDENEYYKWKKQTLCTDCWEKDVNQDKFSFVPAKIVDVDDLLENNPTKLNDQLPTDVKQLVDEYYNLDFEDVIAGGLKTKFQYVDVDKNGFGLTNDDLLYADDKLLNKYISIKKLAPYRSDVVDVNRKKHANLLAAIRASAKRNKKDILKNKPIVQKQEKQQQVQLEVEDAVENNTLNIKSSRLKSYGV
ncbi:hypothetical protein pb186bvf_013939 [Paramecium bursaria]